MRSFRLVNLTTKQEEEGFGTNLSNFKDFMTLDFVKNFGFSAFFLFSYVNCACEQRFNVSLGMVFLKVELQLRKSVKGQQGSKLLLLDILLALA